MSDTARDLLRALVETEERLESQVAIHSALRTKKRVLEEARAYLDRTPAQQDDVLATDVVCPECLRNCVEAVVDMCPNCHWINGHGSAPATDAGRQKFTWTDMDDAAWEAAND